MDISLVKNFADAEIWTHDLPTLVVWLQPVPYFLVTWPSSNISSRVPSAGQCSGGPGGPLYGHQQTIPELEGPEK